VWTSLGDTDEIGRTPRAASRTGVRNRLRHREAIGTACLPVPRHAWYTWQAALAAHRVAATPGLRRSITRALISTVCAVALGAGGLVVAASASATTGGCYYTATYAKTATTVVNNSGCQQVQGLIERYVAGYPTSHYGPTSSSVSSILLPAPTYAGGGSRVEASGVWSGWAYHG
jgi:hypothetical protein